MTIQANEQSDATAGAIVAGMTDQWGSQSAPKTLIELLARLTENGTSNLAALRSKAALVSELLKKPVDQITIDDVDYIKPSLRSQLVSRRLAENSIRTYVNEVQVLLNHAKALGWVPDTLVPTAWRTVLERCMEAKCDVVCRHLMLKRKAPKQVTTEDVNAWIAEYVGMGKAWSTARGKSSAFWKVLFACGELSELPAILQDGFGVALDDFPTTLRGEVLELLNWKQANYAANRPKRGKLRAESAGNLKRSFSELFGYALNVHGLTGITTMSELVTPEVVSQYIEWGINQRKVRGQSMHSRLVVIKAALGQHPHYKDFDLIWLHALIEGIPMESPSELRDKQAAKQIDYSSVEVIPEKIRASRKAAARQGDKQLALAVRDELLMLWLTVLPWRQRNIRECRIDGPRPNIFKARIKPYAPIAKTQWAEEALKTNPDAEFWQFRFSSDETKVGNAVHALVPRPLIPLLEEYISFHRQHLRILWRS